MIHTKTIPARNIYPPASYHTIARIISLHSHLAITISSKFYRNLLPFSFNNSSTSSSSGKMVSTSTLKALVPSLILFLASNHQALAACSSRTIDQTFYGLGNAGVTSNYQCNGGQKVAQGGLSGTGTFFFFLFPHLPLKHPQSASSLSIPTSTFPADSCTSRRRLLRLTHAIRRRNR